MTFDELSPQYQSLLKKMQDLHYGTITNLALKGGEPRLTKESRVTREIALDKPLEGKVQHSKSSLKPQVVKMIKQFKRIRDGTITSIRVQDGIPFRMQVDEHFQ